MDDLRASYKEEEEDEEEWSDALDISFHPHPMASPSSCPPPLVAIGLPASFPRLPSPPPPPPLPVVEGEDGKATKNGVLLDPENPDLLPTAAAKVPASDDTDDDVDGAASSRKKQKPLFSFTSLPSPLRHRSPWPPSSLNPLFRPVGPNRGPLFDPLGSNRQLPFRPDRPNGRG